MSLDVLLPFHRYDQFFQDAVESVLASNYQNFRLILIDDRPKAEQNRTNFFLRKPKINLVKTDGSTGYGNALKVGSQVVSSDVIALMNSDDLMKPNRFTSELKLIEAHDVIFTRMENITASGKIIPSIMGEITGSSFDPFYLIFGSYGANATWCMKSEWWEKYAFFDNQECLDWRIALSSFKNSSIGYVNETMYFYRKHSNQVTFNKNVSKESLQPLLQSWGRFSNEYGLSLVSFEVFSFIATPWNLTKKPQRVELFSWIDQLNLVAKTFPIETRENIRLLIARRFLIGIRHSLSNNDRKNYLLRGSKDLLSFTKDLIQIYLR
jgi:glycosyltransferase involved in cell wall biosynthesis